MFHFSSLCILQLLLIALTVAGNDPGHFPHRPNPWDHCERCCGILQFVLGDKISYPGSTTYEQQQTGISDNTGYWSLQEANTLIEVSPSTADEVAKAVRILGLLDCQFAVRGGGHTSWAGAANIGPEGVTIDLSAIQAVELNGNNTVARIGGGARWGDVYLKLDALGLGVAGGRVAQVGVGGLTLGGGKSFFQSQYGFACDNVDSFEIVTAKGDILQVSETSHSDLFKALKGGSNNFGIVTSFNLRVFRLGKLWAGFSIYNSDTAEAQYAALYNFTITTGAIPNPTADAQVIHAYVATHNSTFFAPFYSYTLPQAWPPPFASFSNLPSPIYSNTRISNLSDFAFEIGATTPNNQRYIFATATFRPDAAFFDAVRRASDSAFANLLPLVPGLQVSTVLQPLTKPMLDSGCNKNALGLCPTDGNLVILDLTASWTDPSPEFDARVNDACHELVRWTQAEAARRGLDHPYLYLNYALEGQDPLASYGAENLRFLKAVARKYDPRGVFQKNVPGGFKLSRSGAGDGSHGWLDGAGRGK